jgi:hypothetical protein
VQVRPWFARKRTSSASTRLSIPRDAGEHGRHHDQRARRRRDAPEKSIFGSGCGVTSRVASQFTSATPSWLAASSERRPRRTSSPYRHAADARAAASRPRSRARGDQQRSLPRYSNSGKRPAARRSVSRPGGNGHPPPPRAAAGPCRSGSSRRARAGSSWTRRSPRRRSPARRPCAPPRPRKGGSPSRSVRCVAVAVAGGEIHPAVDAARVLAQRPFDDAHGLDELAPVHRAQNRRLPMLLLIETWSAACCWFSDCTNARWSGPLRQAAARSRSAAGPAPGPPLQRRASSATKALTIGGFERAMSAITRIRLFGSFSAISVIWSAQDPARFRSILPAAMRTRRDAGSRSAPGAA